MGVSLALFGPVVSSLIWRFFGAPVLAGSQALDVLEAFWAEPE